MSWRCLVPAGQGSVFGNIRQYKKSFLLREYKNFSNISIRKIHFWKYQELFSSRFFLFLGSLGWEAVQVVLNYTTNVVGFSPVTLFKKDSSTGFFGKFCEIFENTFLLKHLWMTASLFNSCNLFNGYLFETMKPIH